MEMKRLNRWLSCFCVLSLTTGTGWGQEEYTRERYQLIVDRSPFGKEELAAGPVGDESAAQVENRLGQELRLCLLSKSEIGDEMIAGFQNLRAGPKEPKSVTLMVGESFRSMKLIEINLADSTAMVEYQGTPLTLELTAPRKAVAPNRQAATRNANTRRTPVPQRRFGGGFQPQQEEEPAEEQLTPEEQAERLAEIRARLQEQQLDIIRKGQPPLPIPLTQEMDDQLVAEGVLPPVDAEAPGE